MKENPFEKAAVTAKAPDTLKQAVLESVSLSSLLVDIADLFTHKQVQSASDFLGGTRAVQDDD